MHELRVSELLGQVVDEQVAAFWPWQWGGGKGVVRRGGTGGQRDKGFGRRIDKKADGTEKTIGVIE